MLCGMKLSNIGNETRIINIFYYICTAKYKNFNQTFVKAN